MVVYEVVPKDQLLDLPLTGPQSNNAISYQHVQSPYFKWVWCQHVRHEVFAEFQRNIMPS
jgi:hypothetical protein